MGMFTDEFFALESPFARFCVYTATISECVKRYKRVSKDYRHNYSIARICKDRLKGISFDKSCEKQFEENGADYHEFQSKAANEILDVILGEGVMHLTRDEMEDLTEMLYNNRVEEFTETLMNLCQEAIGDLAQP